MILKILICLFFSNSSDFALSPFPSFVYLINNRVGTSLTLWGQCKFGKLFEEIIIKIILSHTLTQQFKMFYNVVKRLPGCINKCNIFIAYLFKITRKTQLTWAINVLSQNLKIFVIKPYILTVYKCVKKRLICVLI